MADYVGTQLGNYRLTYLLGRGGFAQVYLGEHVYLKTQTAVKVLHTQVSGRDDLETFLKEARTIAHLVHPHIIRVMDFGVDGGTPFLVMDYAPGGTLRMRHPKGTRLSLARIITYVKQVAEALQYAHDEKLIHRDIKPENMLLGRHNEVLLSDFGIALITQSSGYQSTQDVIGTVAYMSPEQIRGKPRPASDQYSLGIVVYEWLCGDRPFHGSFTELCTQHMFASPPPLREKFSAISSDVEQVVMTALAKNPKARFGSVYEFAQALEQTTLSTHLRFSISPQNARTLRPVPALPSSATPSPPLSQLSEEVPLLEKDLSAQRSLLPVAINPVTERSGRKKYEQRKNRDKTESVWHIGRWQLIAMILSLLFSLGLGSIMGWYEANYSYSPSGALAIVLLGVAEGTFLFLAAILGPWVGLFIGTLDFFIGNYFFDYVFFTSRGLSSSSIDQYLNGLFLTLPLFLPVGLIGFIVGLALLKTKGRYDNFRAIALTEALSAIAIVVLLLIMLSILGFIQGRNGFPFSLLVGYFLALFPYTLPGLILLPILLFIQGKIVNRKNGVI